MDWTHQSQTSPSRTCNLTLRFAVSILSADDKKRVLLDADTGGNGKLTIEKVSSAIRLLGATFFQEVTGNKRIKGKIYDQAVLMADGSDVDEGHPTLTMDTAEDQLSESDVVETFLSEGDEDAVLVADFETAATEWMQSNEELAASLNAYTDARRRLGEKARHRGFWPVQSKGSSKGGKFSSSKGVKGKFQNKGSRKNSATTYPWVEMSHLQSCRPLEGRMPSESHEARPTRWRSTQSSTRFNGSHRVCFRPQFIIPKSSINYLWSF